MTDREQQLTSALHQLLEALKAQDEASCLASPHLETAEEHVGDARAFALSVLLGEKT